jgi:hypothetical protein
METIKMKSDLTISEVVALATVQWLIAMAVLHYILGVL